jgi:exosome complex exonuclease DIS3/RRP44
METKEESKITKKGNIIKIIKEHYLQKDIPCNSKNCSKCIKNNPILEKQKKKNMSFTTSLKEIKNSTYYILLSDIELLFYLDFLLSITSSSTSNTNNNNKNKNNNNKENNKVIIIICETLLNEIKKEDIKEYNRIRELVFQKKICLFSNEHFEETYFENLEKEKLDIYNFRLIINAGKILLLFNKNIKI